MQDIARVRMPVTDVVRWIVLPGMTATTRKTKIFVVVVSACIILTAHAVSCVWLLVSHLLRLPDATCGFVSSSRTACHMFAWCITHRLSQKLLPKMMMKMLHQKVFSLFTSCPDLLTSTNLGERRPIWIWFLGRRQRKSSFTISHLNKTPENASDRRR